MLRCVPVSVQASACVLLGGLTPMEAVGMRQLLEGAGLAVIDGGSDRKSVLTACGRSHPDVVVMDAAAPEELLREVRAAAPDAKLVLWGRGKSGIRVFDAGASEPRQIASAAPEALVKELANRPGPRGE
jgi:DNA-binding NarL/FixJ family response regulator